MTQYGIPKYQSFGKISLVKPKNSNRGLAIFTDVEPVKANTTKIMIRAKLESIPQRCFNFFINKLDTLREGKYRIKSLEENHSTVDCFFVEKTQNNYRVCSLHHNHNQC